MSTGGDASDQVVPSVPAMNADILRNAIAQQKEVQSRANVELDEMLAQQRQALFQGTPGQPSAPPVNPVDDITYRRVLLMGERFTSEVVMAAVLDEDFKKEVGDRAHQILIDKGFLPEETGASDGQPAN